MASNIINGSRFVLRGNILKTISTFVDVTSDCGEMVPSGYDLKNFKMSRKRIDLITKSQRKLFLSIQNIMT